MGHTIAVFLGDYSHMPDIDESIKDRITTVLKAMTRRQRDKRMSYDEVKKEFAQILTDWFKNKKPENEVLHPHYDKLCGVISGTPENDLIEIYRELVALEVMDELLNCEKDLAFIADDLREYLSKALQPETKLSQGFDAWRADIIKREFFNPSLPEGTPDILKKHYARNKRLLETPHPCNAQTLVFPFQRKIFLDSLNAWVQKYQMLGAQRANYLCKKILAKDRMSVAQQIIEIINIMSIEDDSKSETCLSEYEIACKLVKLIHNLRDFPDIEVESLLETAKQSSKTLPKIYETFCESVQEVAAQYLNNNLPCADDNNQPLFDAIPEIVSLAEDGKHTLISLLENEVKVAIAAATRRLLKQGKEAYLREQGMFRTPNAQVPAAASCSVSPPGHFRGQSL